MKDIKPLDLSGLHKFRASELLDSAGIASALQAPLEIALALIDPDPDQPRRRVGEQALVELSESIRVHGVLEPVSVRANRAAAGRYLINRGERRVRAARQAGLITVPAFLDDRADPFAQAVENLHREDMSPLDLALFVQLREAEGMSRADIARRLAKSRSFVTEAAALNDMPPPLRQAIDEGRIGLDLRGLYRLVTAWRRAPETVAAAFERDAPTTRAEVEAMLATQEAPGPAPTEKVERSVARATATRSAGRTVLVVEHGGRRGTLRIKAHDADKGEVRFADGSHAALPLSELRLVCWAAQE
ncbi:ParB/RepB/Spo0J family partition protein [Variovorax paradoxus]|uniref:ParB/RepB/Spo0J family partition protein n=1 Tax=Variovorax paradoxus TaxID=34073 RepID=UPI0019339C8F|nr:ParB/RepB/Spo0J family partition protein [Variovorax paradoxus]